MNKLKELFGRKGGSMPDIIYRCGKYFRIDPDFEREARKIVAGIKKERRWRSRSRGGAIARLRRIVARAMEYLISFFTIIKCWVDSWQAGPENVLDHTLKQSLLMSKLLRLELSFGNPHNLDCYWLLESALSHDLQEGDEEFEDIHFHEKRKDKGTALYYFAKERAVFAKIMKSLFLKKDRDAWAYPICLDNDAGENDKLFFQAAEQICHCMFMLEEIRLGKISKARQRRFYSDVKGVHIRWLKENAWDFESIRQMTEEELLPKYKYLQEYIR